VSTALIPLPVSAPIVPGAPGAVIDLEIASIRRDGGTQVRANPAPRAIEEYAVQMQAGDQFPPVTVWYDGEHYWLSDGFQRVAAAERIGRTSILAEVRRGSLNDARWSSYAANSRHGIRRSQADILNAIRHALEHSNARLLSQNEIAKYLNVPETTFRRLLKKLPGVEARAACIVIRNGRRYEMNTTRIRAAARKPAPVKTRAKSMKELESRLASLRGTASPPVQAVLNIFANWAFGASGDDDCMAALALLHKRWTSLQL
jgi:ParB-like chromosome segregation protein Spo0J